MTNPTTLVHALRPTAEEAFAAYAAQVRAHHEQRDRLSEVPRRVHTPKWAATFRPSITEAPEMAALKTIGRPGDTWIDIGAGGGRFTVPLSHQVARVIALEPVPAMREMLAASIVESGCTNVTVLDTCWPPGGAARDAVPVAEGILAANVLNGARNLRTFLEEMEVHARRVCAVLLSDRMPGTPDPALFEALHGEALCPIPALIEFTAVLGALQRSYEVRAFPVPPPPPVDVDRALEDMRWRYGVAVGSARDARLRTLIIERYGEPSGLICPPPRRAYTAVVSWAPPHGLTLSGRT